MRITIKQKLFIVIFGILLSFTLGFAVINEFFLDDMYSSRYQTILKDFFEDFEQEYEQTDNKGAYLRSEEKKIRGLITIFNANYIVFDTTSPEIRFNSRVPQYVTLESEELIALEKAEYIVSRRHNSKLDVDMIFLIGRISDNEYILVEKSLTEVFHTSTIIKDILLILSIIGFIIASFIAYIASYYITRPLKQIRHAIKAIADFDFNNKLNFSRNDEIGDLGKTLNQISQELELSVNEIQEKNRLLDEDKIKLNQLNKKLQLLSQTDHLTSLSNRMEIDRILDFHERRSQNSDSSFVIILADIDHFKNVNDTYGHQVGDEVLIKISEIMKNMSRESDTVGRWGGEEFIIVLPDISLEDGVRKAEEIRSSIFETDFEKVGKLTISLGVAEYNPNASMSTIVGLADKALYKAKETGRNRTEVCNQI